MADIMKSFICHMDGLSKAAMADAAAKAMAEHCDKRMEKMHRIFRKIKEKAHDGQGGSVGYALNCLAQIEKLAEIPLHQMRSGAAQMDRQQRVGHSRKRGSL